MKTYSRKMEKTGRKTGRHGEMNSPVNEYSYCHHVFLVRTETFEGDEVPFNCPACGQEEAPGITREVVEVVKFLFFIPVLTLQNTHVQCGRCGQGFACLCSLKEMKLMSPKRLERYIRYRPSGAGRGLAIAGFLLCLLLFVNVIVSGLALYMMRGTRGWEKMLAWIGFVVGLSLTGSYVIVMIFL